MSLFALQKVRVVRSGQVILDIPELVIGRGGPHAVLGPNGAGKSTLFSLLSFLSLPDAGTISFSGAPPAARPAELARLRRRVVLVHQNPVLFSTSVIKNVEYGLAMRGASKKEREEQARAALSLVDMEDFANKKARALSGGETQRVAIARALVLAPEALLLDEPVASVDEKNREVIRGLLRTISGTTILFSSHDASFAEGLARSFLHMDRGKMTGGCLES
ncbi:MAG: ATP-binding cassette domain-containing protein [Thermodesulfobacteriota bacterium]